MGARKTKLRRGQEAGSSTNAIISPWIIELVVAIKVFVFYNPECLTAIRYRQNIPVRHLNRRKSVGKLSNLPKGTQLIKTQRSLFHSRGERGFIKSHGIEILPKMVNYSC